MRQRVLITGIGCVSCFGIGTRVLMDALYANVSGIAPITTFDTSTCRAHHAALVRDFDPTAYIAPLKLRRMDAASRLAVVSARLMFDDAGWPADRAPTERLGVALGTYTAGLDSMVEYLRGLIKNGPAGVPALLFSNTVSNAPASLCAIEFGLRGPNVTFNQREASALSALRYAAGAVADGQVDAMMTGAVDTLVETFFKAHDLFRALSPRQSGQSESARPFDRRRNGFSLGEGSVTLLLESEASAVARGARSYGEVLGVGATGSPATINSWPNDPNGLERAMLAALAPVGVSPDEVVALFATANGSPDLDRLESAAVGATFARPIPVVSIKGATGESSASGAASIAAGLLAVGAGRLPPTVGWRERDPACDVSVTADTRECEPGVFMVNTVASGGTNYSAVFRATGLKRAAL
jgi:3-oxoacyl-[acyl-carrier-protein] synthase II